MEDNKPEPLGLLHVLLATFSGVLLGAFVSKVRAPIHQECSETIYPQNSTGNPEHGTQPLPPSVVHVADSVPERDHSGRSKDNTPFRKRFYEWGVAIGTFSLLFVNIFLLCYTKKTANAAKSAAETAHDALIRSNRPWRGVTGIPIVLDLRPPIETQNMLVASMTMVVKNYGPSPALYVNIYPGSFISTATDVKSSLDEDRRAERAACVMASMSVTEQISKTLVGDKVEDVIVPPMGQTIFPNEPAKFYFSDQRFNFRDPVELANKGWRIVGCIAYTDQFSTKSNPIIHHTLFCYHTPGVIKGFIPSQGLVPCNISQHAD